MAEGNRPESGLSLGMTEGHGLALKRTGKDPQVSRRQVLSLGATAVAVAGVALVATRGGQLLEGLSNFLNPETSVQKKASKRWEELEREGSREGMVFNLSVGPDGANVRNEPRVVLPKEDPDSGNRVLTKLKPGYTVAEALSWEGESPRTPGEKVLWYAVKLKNGRIGFIWSGNFVDREQP